MDLLQIRLKRGMIFESHNYGWLSFLTWHREALLFFMLKLHEGGPDDETFINARRRWIKNPLPSRRNAGMAREAGIEFDHGDGVSAACFNLAMWAQGMSGRQIADNWRNNTADWN